MTVATAVRIRVENLCKNRGEATVLDRVTLEARAGEVTCLVGPNGSGKSTLFKCLAGISNPLSGRALIDGRPLAELADPARTVGFHLEATASHPGRTGAEELTLACIASGQSRVRRHEIAEEVGLDSRTLRKRVGKYSLGMRQRLGIGVALIADPEILVLDEPFGGLDYDGICWMRRSLRGWADAGRAILITNHYFAEMDGTVDRLYALGPGGRGARSIELAQLRAAAADPQSGFSSPQVNMSDVIGRWYDDATRR